MKQSLQYHHLPLLTLVLGTLGLLLRLLQRQNLNDQGFVLRGQFTGILLAILTVVVLLGLFLVTRPLVQGSKYSFNFPISTRSAFGILAAAFGLSIQSVFELLMGPEYINTLCSALGLVATMALAHLAYGRWTGQKATVLAPVMLCVYLVVRLICLYRSWSADPQLPDYCYQLLTIVCIMLAAYQRAAFSAELGNRRQYTFFCLAGIYCSIVALGETDMPVFYLSFAIWMLFDLCKLNPLRSRGGAPA